MTLSGLSAGYYDKVSVIEPALPTSMKAFFAKFPRILLKEHRGSLTWSGATSNGLESGV
jgi:hypothetical protein